MKPFTCEAYNKFRGIYATDERAFILQYQESIL